MRSVISKYILILTLIPLLLSCGGDNAGNNNVTAPPGSTITVNPSEVSVTNGLTDLYLTEKFFSVSLTDSAGRPIRDAVIMVDYTWANDFVEDLSGCFWAPGHGPGTGTGSTTQVIVQFFDSFDSNDPVISPMEINTDEYGVAKFRVEFLSGCLLEYSGPIDFRSGSNFASIDFAVSGA